MGEFHQKTKYKNNFKTSRWKCNRIINMVTYIVFLEMSESDFNSANSISLYKFKKDPLNVINIQEKDDNIQFYSVRNRDWSLRIDKLPNLNYKTIADLIALTNLLWEEGMFINGDYNSLMEQYGYLLDA